jgi:hypothetical protein
MTIIQKITDLTNCYITDLNLGTNPSIAFFNDHFYCLIRVLSPFSQSDKFSYTSKNWLFQLNNDLTVTQKHFLDDSFIRRDHPECKNGLEDGRLFVWKKQLWGLFSGYSYHDNKHSNTMVLCLFIDNKIDRSFLIHSPFDEFREKNWMPLVIKEDLYFVYSIEPLIIFKYLDNKLINVNDSVSANTIHTKKYPFSGSSPFICINNEYLAVVHKRHSLNPLYKLYLKIKKYIFSFVNISTDYNVKKIQFLHYFVLLDSSFDKITISKPFYFEEIGVEFAAGISILDNKIYLSYGVLDKLSKIIVLNLNPIKKLFY